MKYRSLSVVLTATLLLLSAGLSSAIENTTDTPQQAASKTDASAKPSSAVAARRKHPATVNLVDINSATKEELMKLPGISEEVAGKIIAGRPFGSKAWLVSHNIITKETYQTVQARIVCKLTRKDVEEIRAHAHQTKK